MARVNQGISNDNVLTPSGSEDHNLRNIIASERLDTPGTISYESSIPAVDLLVDRIRLGLVAVEADHREFLYGSTSAIVFTTEQFFVQFQLDPGRSQSHGCE